MAAAPMVLVYDGQCPVCNAYARMLRLRKTAGSLRLLDARQGGALVDEISAAGLDLDQGMVLKVGGRLYYGADALHALALLSSPVGVFNRLNYYMFSSRTAAGLLYPLLRFCRNLLLRALGRRPLDNLGRDNR